MESERDACFLDGSARASPRRKKDDRQCEKWREGVQLHVADEIGDDCFRNFRRGGRAEEVEVEEGGGVGQRPRSLLF